MKQALLIRLLFLTAAAYDGVVGALFLVAPDYVFDKFEITKPHMGFVQFPAALLIVFALMFLRIGIAPLRNRRLIIYGVLLKVAYAGVVFRYWFTSEGIPNLWKPFAIVDVVMAVLFLWAMRRQLRQVKIG